MNMATSLIQVRIDNDLKTKANQIFSDLGLDISSAIRMFLKRSVLENGIPFSMVLPADKNTLNLNGLQALDEISNSAKKAGVSNMSLDEINEEINLARRQS